MLIQNYDKSANLRLAYFYLYWLRMNILAVAAHWDDIELGCGITLKKLSKKVTIFLQLLYVVHNMESM